MRRRGRGPDPILTILLTLIGIMLVIAVFYPRQAEEDEEDAGLVLRGQEMPAVWEKEDIGILVRPEESARESRRSRLVQVARQEIGNTGGEKYWRWYGFSERVEWCACFVSWCADQCGYIEDGTLQKFSICDGAWLKEAGRWREREEYEPQPGDLIFFDWVRGGVQDGAEDHVGIVESVDQGYVCTIEGNCSDQCLRQRYLCTDIQIMGYAVLE